MVGLQSMPFGAEIGADGVRFALWAPSAGDVTLSCDGVAHVMPTTADGWRRLTLPDAKAGSRYVYRMPDGLAVPDPASRFQPLDGSGRSEVVDPHAYRWQDAAWLGRPWAETVVEEVHVGTATPEGTFAALARKLEAFAKLGVTAIELMPIADCPGNRNWGYDGVLPFAVEHAYGRPDDLKRLVDRAHSLGLMMFLDVVYNHFGPAGNYLPVYAKSFFTERHQTPWGAGINFDGADAGRIVREFFVHNALYWLGEFHFDGLRFDAVHAILDDSELHFLSELPGRLRAAFPSRHIHLMLENEHNEAGRLTGPSASGYDAQWDDDIHHCWHRLLTGEAESYYADFGGDTVGRLGRCLAEGFAYQGEASGNLGHGRGEPSGHLPPSAFVAFLQNHDQVGNRALGERLTSLARPEQLALARALLLLSPQIPMLFMGEEWGATTPFLFFVDFDDDPGLQQAVREGRRAEFKKFAAFSAPGAEQAVPDPTKQETFDRSKIDWSEAAREPFAGVLADTKSLLAVRHSDIVPLIKSGFKSASYTRHGDGGLAVQWQFGGGNLGFFVNFGPTSWVHAMEMPGLVLWQSEGVTAGEALELAPWSGLVVKSAAS